MSSVLTSASASGPGFAPMTLAIRDVYASEIYFQAMPNMRWDQFATRKEELSTQPGSTIIMPKAGSLKRGGTLVEGNRIQVRSMSMSTTSLSVSEQGNAVGVTERLLQTSFFDNMAMATMLLGRDLAIVLDLQLRDAALTTTNKVYANGKASRNSLTANDVLGTREVYAMSAQLETQAAPKWNQDFYVCFIHPRQAYSLRQAPGWVNVNTYGIRDGGMAGSLFTGELGRFNDMRFISTMVMPNGANSTVDSTTGDYADPGYTAALDPVATGALGTTVYQAIAFGEYTFGHAVATPVELRDNGVADFGREHALAWYAIWGSGILEANNAVICESAAFV